MKVIRHLSKVALLSASLAAFGGSTSAFAAIANIGVGHLGTHFNPVVTNIFVNDQVLWNWEGTFHSTTSGTGGVPNGLWDTGIITSLPHTFMNSFPNPGNFPFYCSQHVTLGMTGEVIVAVGNLPPTVAITNPVPGAVFAAPASVTIQASASDDGTVTNVQFLVGASVVTNKATAPFFAVADNLAVGSNTLSAIASDNNGATATNKITISVVTPAPVLLSAPQPVPPGEFRFSYTANDGLSYIVQSAANLTTPNWTTLGTNMATGSSMNFTDLNATLDAGYYRVGRLPNP